MKIFIVDMQSDYEEDIDNNKVSLADRITISKNALLLSLVSIIMTYRVILRTLRKDMNLSII
jgi:hypothetical protein